MNLLIDARGRRQQRGAVRLSCAVWRKGFIHIREEKRRIVVSLSPSLVKGPTLAAAVYAIAEMNPEYTSLILEKGNCVAIVFDADWRTACKRICELVAVGRHGEDEQIAAFRDDAEPAAEPEELDEPEQIIAAALKHHPRRDPAALTRQILEQLWEAGYEIRPTHC